MIYVALDPAHRPQLLKISRSFSRLEPANHQDVDNKTRSRSSTLSSVSLPGAVLPASGEHQDIYRDSSNTARRLSPTEDETDIKGDMSTNFNELPIEVMTLTDRYIQ